MKLNLKFVHRFLALLLGCFILAHLAGHLFAYAGPEAHQAVLDGLRGVYRLLIVEIVLIGAIIVQLTVGAGLALRRWRSGQRSGWQRLQIVSGALLGSFVLFHAGAALTAQSFWGLDTNFYWPAGTLKLGWLPYLFFPYYIAGLTALFAHVACALHFAGMTGSAKVVLAAGLPAACAILLPFSGVLFPVVMPAAHLEYFSLFPGAVP